MMTRSGIFGAAALAGAIALAGCGGDGSGGGGSSGGTNSILLTGGEGTLGDGGDGGRVTIKGIASQDVRVLRTGSVDTSFEVPTELPALGDNPLVILTDTILAVGPDGRVSGTAIPTATATGLHIDAGATLTLVTAEENEDADFLGLLFDRGVIIDGTLQVGTRNLDITSWGMRIGKQGHLLASASESNSGDEGEAGGGLEIECRGTCVVEGRITARGADGVTGGQGGFVEVETFGAPGAAVGSIYVTGTIDVSGGDGFDGAGGNGGGVDLETDSPFRGVFFSGTIVARGGVGHTIGGFGGEVELSVEFGDLVTRGTIDLSGGLGLGAVHSDGTAFSGGFGGFLDCSSAGGNLRLGGTLSVRGGEGAAEVEGKGGRGGGVLIEYVNIEGLPPVDMHGSMHVGMEIDARGGDGRVGAEGGEVFIGGDRQGIVLPVSDGPRGDPEFAPRELVLFGYDRFEVSGGASTFGRGGDAAGARRHFNPEIPRDIMEDPGVYVQARAESPGLASARFEADVIGLGGAATEMFGEGGRGGRGAKVEIKVRDARELIDERISATVVTGRFDLRGGDGERGGRGGQLAVLNEGLFDNSNVSPARAVTVLGAVDASGGSGRNGLVLSGAGGAGGQIAFLSFSGGALTSLGGLRAVGGACPDGRGGDGGMVGLLGGAVVRRGDIICDGGAGRVGGSGGRAEEENEIEEFFELSVLDNPIDIENETDDQSRADGGIGIQSLDTTSDVRGRLSVRGGRGTQLDGPVGGILFDGIDVDVVNGEVNP